MSVCSVFRSRIDIRSFVRASLPLGAFTLHSCLLRYRPRLLQSFVVASPCQRDVRDAAFRSRLLFKSFVLHFALPLSSPSGLSCQLRVCNVRSLVRAFRLSESVRERVAPRPPH